MNTAADVCDLVRKVLLESTDWRLRHLEPVTSHSRSFSTHMTLRVQREGADPQLIFVKFIRGITDDRGRLEQLVDRDNRVTRYLAQAFAEIPGVAIPTPIAFSRDHLMLITEFVEGTRFQDKILNNARFPTSASAISCLADESYRCGKWLRAFQDTTRRFLEEEPLMGGDDLLGMQTIVRLVTDRLEALHSESVIDARDLRRLLAYVDNLAGEVRPEELVSVGVHGDFFPGNLLVHGDTVIGIDFVMFRTGAPYYDATYFAYQLETVQMHPAYSAATIKVLEHAFLRGYAPEQESSDIWNWNSLCKILFVMHSAARLLKLVNAAPPDLPRRLLTRTRIRLTRRRLMREVQVAVING